jgi:hypothetical protein
LRYPFGNESFRHCSYVLWEYCFGCGHANPIATTVAARQREQDAELQPLSELRARTVVDYLVGLGVSRNRLSAFGIGGARPVIPYADRDNWWKNRRVEFILVR